MSTTTRHYDMGRATYDLATNTRGYVYRDFTVDGDVPITVEHVCPDVMSPSKWRTNLDQTLTPNVDGTKLTYTDGCGKTSVFERKFYYVDKGRKFYVTLADCEEEAGGQLNQYTEPNFEIETPNYQRDSYGNYVLKNTPIGNSKRIVYERFEDIFGNEIKKDDALKIALKQLDERSKFLKKKLVYFYADHIKKNDSENGEYPVKLFNVFDRVNAIDMWNVDFDNILKTDDGKEYFYDLLQFQEVTDKSSTNWYVDETSVGNMQVDQEGRKYIGEKMFEYIEYFEFSSKYIWLPEILNNLINELKNVCDNYATLLEKKVYCEGAMKELLRYQTICKETFIENRRAYSQRYDYYIDLEEKETNAIKRDYYEAMKTEQFNQGASSYQQIRAIIRNYRQLEENLKEIKKLENTLHAKKEESVRALKLSIQLLKQQPLDFLTLADGTKLGFDYDGRMVSVQGGDKGVYLRYEEGLLRDASDSKGVMATFSYTADGKWDTVVSRDGDTRKYIWSGSLMNRIENRENTVVTFEYEVGYFRRVKDAVGREIVYWSVLDPSVSLMSPYKTIDKDGGELNQSLYTVASLKRISNAYYDDKGNMYLLDSANGLVTHFQKTQATKSKHLYNKYLSNRLNYSLDKAPSPSAADASLPIDRRFFRSDGTLNFENAEVIAFLAAAKGAAYNYDSEMRMTKAWQNGTMTEYSKFYGVQPGLAVSTDKYGRTGRASFAYTPEGRLSRREIDGVVTEYAYNRYGELTSERTYPLDNPMLSTFTEYEAKERGEEDTGEEILPYIAPLAGAVEPQDTQAVFSFEGDYFERTSVTAEDEEHGVVSNFTAGYLTRAESANGSRVDFARDALGRAVGIALDGEAYANLQHVQQVGMSPYGNTQTVYYDKTTVSFANDAEEALEQVSLNGQVFETNYRNAGATVNLTKNTIDSEDRLLTHTDCVADEKTTYAYDTDDRVSARTVTGAGGGAIADGIASTAAVYTDGTMRSYTAKLKYKGEEETLSTNYQYTDTANPKLAEVTLPNARRVTYEYDGFGRPVEKRVWRTPRTQPPYCKNDPTHMISQRLSYRSAKGSTQNLIASERFAVGGREDDLTKYTYDGSGRVTRIDSAGTGVVNYTYDEGGRLTREDNKALDRTVRYAYDGNGNIRRKTEYSYCLGDLDDRSERKHEYYAYDTVHRDRLLSYNGEPCEYDKLGNPTMYRDKPLTWERCRLLSSYGGGAGQVTFRYDGQGMRRSKHVGPFTWKYVYDGARLVRTYCEMGTRLAEVLDFGYDGDGLSTILWKHKVGEEWEEHEYIVRRNILGDVTQLYDTLGNLCVQYRYDAWGQVYPITIFDYHGIARVNPILYRGYVYDKETELYYLNSRYYDPETGRFLNADSLEYLEPESVYGINLYAYCGGDPVNNVDPMGNKWWEFWKWDWKAIGKGLASAAAIIGGIALCFVPGAQAFGAGLIVFGGASLVGGIAGEVTGAGFNAGWNVGAIIGGAIGIGIAAAPAILSALSFTSTITIPTIGFGLTTAGTIAVVAGTTAVVVPTGAIALGAAAIGLLFFAKGAGSRMGHNQHENKQFRDAMRELGISRSDPRWRKAHDALDGTIDKYKELLEFIKKLLGL